MDESRAMDGAPGDLEVVRRVLRGESALFEVLMRRYNQRLYRTARAILRDEAEAEDVMQQAYVNAYQHLDQFAERASFATWITRIAIHEALARARRRARVGEIDAMTEYNEDGPARLATRDLDPEQQALAGELRCVLEQSVDALPQAYRSVFVLREVEGLTTAEVAACLEVSEDVVKTRLHRARGMLREEIFARAGLTAAHAFAFHATRCDRVVAGAFERLGLRPAVH
jgi:RNA polymerase sigma-70 factor (ECF subfamily)